MKEKFVVVKRIQDVCIHSEYNEINNMFLVTFSKFPNNFYKTENNIAIGDKVEIIKEQAQYNDDLFYNIKYLSRTQILIIEKKKIIKSPIQITESLIHLRDELKKRQNDDVLLYKINLCLYDKYPINKK